MATPPLYFPQNTRDQRRHLHGYVTTAVIRTCEGVDGPFGEPPAQGVQQRRLVQVREGDQVRHHPEVVRVAELQVGYLRLPGRDAAVITSGVVGLRE